MGIAEILLLSIGLSMDAFAVSVCKGIESRKASLRQMLLCGIWFGGFQGLMPFIGYLLSSKFAFVIDRVSSFIAFILLIIIGGNMIRESFAKEEDTRAGFDIKTMFIMAVATSIDALAVGITFVAVPVNMFNATNLVNTASACVIITLVTFVFSFIGVRIGNVFGIRYKSGAEAAGGFVLVFIALKILLEHLGLIDFINDGDVLFGLLIPFAGTIIGSALVFFIKDNIGEGTKNILTGMAGGIMLSCAVWSLLYPSIEKGRAFIAAAGFIIGVIFQYTLDKTVPHTHVFTRAEEGPSNSLKRSSKVMLSEFIHHVPEGMAVGVIYAGFLSRKGDVTLPAALALAVGIAIQNIPEGAFVSSPLAGEGEEKGKSFLMGVISGVVEPLVGIAAVILVSSLPGILFFVMAVTSGAITFIVLEETIPSMNTGTHSDKGTISFTIFFTLMMLLIFIGRG